MKNHKIDAAVFSFLQALAYLNWNVVWIYFIEEALNGEHVNLSKTDIRNSLRRLKKKGLKLKLISSGKILQFVEFGEQILP